MLAFGDTIYDAPGLITWDAVDAFEWDDSFPLSDADASLRPPWDSEGQDWPVSSTVPTYAYEMVYKAASEDATLQLRNRLDEVDDIFIPAGSVEADIAETLANNGYPDAVVNITPPDADGVVRVSIGLWVGVNEALSASTNNGLLLDTTAASSYNNTNRPYRIQVVNTSGGLVREITKFIGGQWVATANEAAILDFNIVASGYDTVVADLMNPAYRVRLLNSYGQPVGIFRTSMPEYVHDNEMVMLKWQGLDAIAQLASEVVSNYAVTGVTLKEAINSLLTDWQVNEKPIRLVEISANCATQLVDVNLQDTTVLAALREMQAQAPQPVAGYFWLDVRNGLHWVNNVGASGKTIAIGERLQGVTKTIQYQDLATRVYAYGEGADANTRLTLLDADQPAEYIENAAAVALYGTLSAVVTSRDISDAAALLRLAQRVLEERSSPQIEYQINVIDLARLRDATPPLRTWTPDGGTVWTELYVGGAYRLVDASAGIDTTIRLKRATFNLDNPLPVTVELDNRVYTIADILAEFKKAAKNPVNLDNGELYPSNVTSGPSGSTPGPDSGLQDGDGNNYAGNDPPLAPTPTGDPGESPQYARADHTHPAQVIPDAVLWGGSVTAFPSAPDTATIVWKSNGVPPQLWIGGGGSTDWTPLQYATDDTGGA